MFEVKIKKLAEGVNLPSYQTEGAAGMDISACLTEDIILKPMERKLIPTGFAIAVPDGYAAYLYARSGLASKKGITLPNCVGVIDSDYRGEVKVALVNLSDEPFEIKNGDRIAQMVISPVIQAILIEADELSETERAGGGFGSTGV
ncbi:MAG: dUTP diphosphatase [Clostridia bacterium]|nr:dUTP diphosphatase [Clostridia bacterium]